MKKSVMLLMIAVSLMCPHGFCMGQSAAERGSIFRRQQPVYSSFRTAFADAFADPNIVIGVFELSSPSLIQSDEIDPNLPSEKKIETIDHYRAAGINFSLRRLRCLELIQGDMAGQYAFISVIPARLAGEPSSVRTFHPYLGSKWILALRKTTPEFRAARYSQNIGKFEFLNDDTFFTVWGYQYGALCLEWSEDVFEKPDWAVKISEDVVDDFKIMYEISTDLRQSRLDPSRAADMAEMLETEQAKSIFAEILRKEKTEKSRDQ